LDRLLCVVGRHDDDLARSGLRRGLGRGFRGFGLLGAGVGLGSSCAILSASLRTPATREDQPLPKVLHVFSRRMNMSRASQMEFISAAGFCFATAASVTGPISPSCLTPTAACRYFAALPGPLFTAKSNTA